MQYQFSDNVNGLKPSAIREILKHSSQPGMIPFSAGNPSAEAFPVEAVRKISAEIFKDEPIAALQYSVTEGYTPLRQLLTDYLKTKHHIGTEQDELLITSGAQQVMSLAAKVLLNRGDTVLFEDPSFIGSLNSFRSYGIQLKGVPMEADGMNMQALEQLLNSDSRVRFIYTIPNFQNPTGITMSLAKRRRLYELAVQHGVVIIEDDPYGELRFKGEFLPAIKSFDTEGAVIYSGSFSKVLAPGIRVGYAVANRQLLSKMTVCKQTDDVHTGIFSQMLAYRFMKEYDFEAHLTKLRAIYRQKAELAMRCARKSFGNLVSFYPVEGGLFLWCRLPEQINMLEFCKKGIENGVAVVPGTAFLANEEAMTQCFRVNFSTPSEEQIKTGFATLGNLVKEMLQ